jgi:TetR/AcrR family transcriptional regulator, repressor for neighboring sulfatase
LEPNNCDDHLTDDVAAKTDAAAGDDALNATVERHWRVVAWAILDGYPVRRLQPRFPYVSRLVERAQPHHPDDFAARVAAGNAAAFELGWRLFEPFPRSATGISDVPSLRLPEAINAAVAGMLEPDNEG